MNKCNLDIDTTVQYGTVALTLTPLVFDPCEFLHGFDELF